jgi:PRTRC genetic system protein A
MSSADLRDLAIQNSCPAIAAPRFGALPDIQNGQRVIVAANGLFVQIKLDWLDCVHRLGDIAPTPPLPYGVVQERISFRFGVIPVALLEQFIAAGRAGLPNEVAGGLIYSRTRGSLRLQIYDAVEHSPDRIEYRMPELDDDESIAIDLHTHGRCRAFWSAIDDRDDQGIKVSGVFGSLHRPKPDAAFRLVINGSFKSLRHPWEVDHSAIPSAAPAAFDTDAELDDMRRWPILKWLGWR